jgi:acyl transferase domain-containing protein
VAGTSLMLNPDMHAHLSSLHMLSPDGRCYAFDSRANGYARGEGFAAVILKPLVQALEDNDTIRAVIRGSGCNQDGHTPGITAPNAESQADLIRSTYKVAGLGYSDTTYVEAHGTGELS